MNNMSSSILLTMKYCPGVADLGVPQLAAVASQAVQGGVQHERLNRGLLSVRPSQGVSPHVVMGKTWS